jgi:hypothetical protein
MSHPFQRRVISSNIGIEVISGVDLSPIEAEEVLFGDTRIVSLPGVQWLNDGEIVFGLRDVAAGEQPLLSNRPKNDHEPLSGEVLMYDHILSRPLDGELVYYPVTPTGRIDVLRNGQFCTLQLTLLRKIGETLASSESASTNNSLSDILAA